MKDARWEMAEQRWVKEWPTEPGYYWAYGVTDTVNPDGHHLFMVEVIKTFDGTLCFWDQDVEVFPEHAQLIWMRWQKPDPEASGAWALWEELGYSE